MKVLLALFFLVSVSSFAQDIKEYEMDLSRRIVNVTECEIEVWGHLSYVGYYTVVEEVVKQVWLLQEGEIVPDSLVEVTTLESELIRVHLSVGKGERSEQENTAKKKCDKRREKHSTLIVARAGSPCALETIYKSGLEN